MTETDQHCHPTLTGMLDETPQKWTGECNPTTDQASNGIEILPKRSRANTNSSTIDQISQIMMEPNAILCGDSFTVLQTLPDEHFACCITSPPYWDTRYSGLADHLGAELDHCEYIKNLLQIFREVRRTLTPSGTLWLVIGDTYASDDRGWWEMCRGLPPGEPGSHRSLPDGFKSKDLMGIPWRLAMELQKDGWYLRSDIIWSIPNHRSEPVRDRPARGHDYVFLFAKSEHYSFHGTSGGTVWEIPTVSNPPINYAVFPEPLVERCMRAGSLKEDVVLDPFFGSGTVGIVAKRLKRRYVGIELNPGYVSLAAKRIREAD
jgi:site-specific DNA-methyltransferase (cytosine-N4-specific)